jgi:hypothetical protein
MTSIDRQGLNVRESFVDTVRINSAMMGNEMHFLSYTAIDRYYQDWDTELEFSYLKHCDCHILHTVTYTYNVPGIIFNPCFIFNPRLNSLK